MTATDLIDSVDAAIVAIAEVSATLFDQNLDEVELVTWRARAHAAQRAANELVSSVDTLLLATVPVGATVIVPGAGQVIVEVKGRSTTWGAKLARTLAARIADTPADEDGVALPPAVLCEKTADELVQVFGLSVPSARFRTSEVKARGLKPGAYQEWTDGQPQVRFIDGATS